MSLINLLRIALKALQHASQLKGPSDHAQH